MDSLLKNTLKRHIPYIIGGIITGILLHITMAFYFPL